MTQPPQLPPAYLPAGSSSAPNPATPAAPDPGAGLGGDAGLAAAREAAARPSPVPLITLGVGAIAGLALLGLGIWAQTLPVSPMCGDEAMMHGDICDVTSSRSGELTESYGYAEALAREERSRLGYVMAPAALILASLGMLAWNLVVRRSTPAAPTGHGVPGARWHGAPAWGGAPGTIATGLLFVTLAAFSHFFLNGPGFMQWAGLGILGAIGVAELYFAKPVPAEIVRTDDQGFTLTRGERTTATPWSAVSGAAVTGKGADARFGGHVPA